MLYGAHFHVNAQIVLSFVVVYPLLTSYLYTQLGFFSGLLLPLMNFLKLPPGTPVYWKKNQKQNDSAPQHSSLNGPSNSLLTKNRFSVETPSHCLLISLSFSRSVVPIPLIPNISSRPFTLPSFTLTMSPSKP